MRQFIKLSMYSVLIIKIAESYSKKNIKEGNKIQSLDDEIHLESNNMKKQRNNEIHLESNNLQSLDDHINIEDKINNFLSINNPPPLSP